MTDNTNAIFTAQIHGRPSRFYHEGHMIDQIVVQTIEKRLEGKSIDEYIGTNINWFQDIFVETNGYFGKAVSMFDLLMIIADSIIHYGEPEPSTEGERRTLVRKAVYVFLTGKEQEDEEGEVEESEVEETQSIYANIKSDFSSDVNFSVLYSVWTAQNRVEFENEQEMARNVKLFEEMMEQIEFPFNAKPPEIIHSTVVFKPVDSSNGKPPGLDGLVEIFDKAILSTRVPFIICHPPGMGVLSKIKEDGIHKNLIVYNLLGEKGRSTLQLILWLGKNDTSQNSPKDTFVSAEYDIISGELSFRLDRKFAIEVEEIEQDLAAVFPTLNFSNKNEVNIAATVYVNRENEDLDVNMAIFNDIIMTNNLLSNYLFTDESDKPACIAERQYIIYRNPSTKNSRVRFSMSRLERGVQFRIASASTYEDLYEFSTNMRYFMRMYKDEAESIRTDVYDPWFKDVLTGYDMEYEEEEEKIEGKLEVLQRSYPGPFDQETYSSDCQKNRQPLVVSDEEAEEISKEIMLNKDNEQVLRQVLKYPPVDVDEEGNMVPRNPFPSDAPTINIVCDPNSAYRYPGFRTNKGVNNNVYPCVPCCFTEDQRENLDKVCNPSGTAKSERKHKLKVAKILEPGQIGTIPSEIEGLLSSVGIKGSSRYGVAKGRNAFLSCVLTVVDPLNRYDEEELGNRRIEMTSAINKSVLRQELYDKSETVIESMLINNNIFLDPDLYYRAVEEYFDVNIFTFYLQTIGSVLTGGIQYPRSRYGTIRHKNLERKTILILRHSGSSGDVVAHPHCELIVDGGRRGLFDKNVTESVYNIFYSSMRQTVWNFVDGEIMHLYGRTNVYPLIDVSRSIPDITAQYIDNCGKLRAILTSEGLPFIVPPSQPLSVPSVSIDDFRYHSYEYVRNLITGVPTFLDRRYGEDDKSYIAGLWYQVGPLKSGVYIPISEEEESEIPEEDRNIPIGETNPLYSGQDIGQSEIISKKRRLGLVIIQLIRYLYLIMNKEERNPSTFMKRYVRTLKNAKDDIYKVEEIPYLLPEGIDTQAAIAVLERNCPSFFRKEKFTSYSREFTNRLEGKLYEFNLTIESFDGVKPFRNLPARYMFETDFRSNDGIKVFLSERELEIWKNEEKRLSEENNVLNKLDPSISTSIEPIIYIDPKTRIVYMIQNVLGGEKERALTVGYKWAEELTNVGFLAEIELPEEGVAYKEYGISITKAPVLTANYAEGVPEGSYVTILSYGNENYAALIKLS